MVNHEIFSGDLHSTALSEDDKADLILSWVSNRDDLNAAEAENITQARLWLFRQPTRHQLSERMIRNVHRRMFGDVWKWAGVYRHINTNIGVHWPMISAELKKLVDDTQYWMEHKVYPPDELVARFHHRLVWIHPFPNGNGRLSRLLTDWLVLRLEQPPLTWIDGVLIEDKEPRRQYIASLKAADRGDFNLLLDYLRG